MTSEAKRLKDALSVPVCGKRVRTVPARQGAAPLPKLQKKAMPLQTDFPESAASTSFAKLAGTQLQRLVDWRCPHHGDCIQVCYSEKCSTAWSCAVVHHGKKDADLELHFCDSTEVCRLDLDEDEWRFEKDGVDQDHQAARHGDRVAVFKHDEQRWYCGEVHTVADERRVEVRFDTIIAECELQVGCDVWLYECELGCKGRREALYHHFASSTS